MADLATWRLSTIISLAGYRLPWNDAFGYVHGLTSSSTALERNLIYRLFTCEWDRYADPTLGFYTYRALSFPMPPELEAGRFCIQLPENDASKALLQDIKLPCRAS